MPHIRCQLGKFGLNIDARAVPAQQSPDSKRVTKVVDTGQPTIRLAYISRTTKLAQLCFTPALEFGPG
jgi:hypothetical protein